MLGLKKPVEPEPLPTSKRHAQLLAKKKPRIQESQSNALTKRDVIALQNDKSPAVRSAIAMKFGRQFDQLATSPNKSLAEAVLQMLVKDVSVEVRSKLARELSQSANLPAKSVSALARDDIAVAQPILQQSPLLQDDELLNIVKTQSMQYALAVAGRDHVSEELTDALIDTGSRDVVLKVAGNAGAQVSKAAMQRVINDHSDDLDIQDRLARRPAVPFEIAEQLVGIIGDHLEWELVNTRRLSREEASAIMKSIKDSVNVNLTAHSNDYRKQMVLLREQIHGGNFEHADVVKALRDGDIQTFELGLALFAKVDVATARKLIYSDDRRRLAALCAAGDFNPPHYLTMRMAIELAHESANSNKPTGDYSEDSVRYVLNQYERMRLDDEKIRDLLNI